MVGALAILVGCSIGIRSQEMIDKTTPIVSVSAKGWTLKPGPPEDTNSSSPTTIVMNPQGEAFNIGTTQYPDVLPATLWIVEVKELNARFLLIHVPPVASASVEMPILYLDREDRPTWAGSIRQRWEFKIHRQDNPGYNPKAAICDGERYLRDILFTDINGDGTPELEEEDIWRGSGSVTYFRFTEDKKFVPVRIVKYICGEDTEEPLWIETWACGTDRKMTLISRKKVESEK